MIDKNFLLKSFRLESPPSWPCPNCTTGVLLPSLGIPKSKDGEDSFRWGYDAASHAELSSYNGDPFATGVFVGLLKCNNKDCVESVAISGSLGLEQNDEESCRRGESSWIAFCIPNYFSPPLRIFQIPENCPRAIRNDILASFSLFWSDEAASANRLRSAIERFLTVLGIDRLRRDKSGKPKRHSRMNADERIRLLEKQQPDLASWLMAIKWIGNEGSHGGELSRQDVIEGFEMLEHVLYEHYVQHLKKLTKIRSRVISRRGKPPRKKQPLQQARACLSLLVSNYCATDARDRQSSHDFVKGAASHSPRT